MNHSDFYWKQLYKEIAMQRFNEVVSDFHDDDEDYVIEMLLTLANQLKK